MATPDYRLQMTTPWLACPRQNPQACLRLFCFPYAGGGASIYYSWPDAVSPQVEICPVQLPGREHRLGEAPYTQLNELVRAIRQALQPYMDKPFALYGHSMGGLLAFELARLLRNERGPQPLHLFVSGCRAPHVADAERITYNLPVSELLEELRTLNGTPQEVLESPELIEVMLPTLRADFEIVETYAYSVELPLSCHISVFGGLQDDKVERQHLEAWREHTTALCSVRMFPGDHFFLRTAQSALLTIMAQKLHIIADSVMRTECL